MQQTVQERVPEVTGVLSVVSLALVFGAVGGYVPDGLLPRVDSLLSAIPHLNAVISLTAIVTILYGVSAIRNGNLSRHKQAMLASTALFAGFLVLYLYRVSLEGPSSFDGPATIRNFIYLPLLGIHILLAVVCIPFVYYALLLAGTHPIEQLPKTAHPWAGKIAASLWIISFALGFIVYLMLYILF